MPYKTGQKSILDDDDFADFIRDKAEQEAEGVYSTLKEANDPDIDQFCERSFVLGYCIASGRMMDNMADMMRKLKDDEE